MIWSVFTPLSLRERVTSYATQVADESGEGAAWNKGVSVSLITTDALTLTFATANLRLSRRERG